MIPIERESDNDPAEERCCFCRIPTKFWTRVSGRKCGQQVACCESCASRASERDIPSKHDWCRRELIARRPTPASEHRQLADVLAHPTDVA